MPFDPFRWLRRQPDSTTQSTGESFYHAENPKVCKDSFVNDHKQPQAKPKSMPPATATPFEQGVEETTSAPPRLVGNTTLPDRVFDRSSESVHVDHQPSPGTGGMHQARGRRLSALSSTDSPHEHIATDSKTQNKPGPGASDDGSLQGGTTDAVPTRELNSDANNTPAHAPHSSVPASRPKLTPKPHTVRESTSVSTQSRNSYASEIHMEQSTPSDPLPEDYIGTFRGVRYTSPPVSCGMGSHMHKLACGHWIRAPPSSSLPAPEPCVVNCASPTPNLAFVCPQCHATVQSALKALPVAEQTRLHAAKQTDHTLYVGMAVEFVVRHSSTMHTDNVAATVAAILDEGRSRAAGPCASPAMDLREYVGEKQRDDARKAFVKGIKFVRGEKRKSSRGEVDETAVSILPSPHAAKKRSFHRREPLYASPHEIPRRAKRKAISISTSTCPDTATASSSMPSKRRIPPPAIPFPGFTTKDEPNLNEEEKHPLHAHPSLSPHASIQTSKRISKRKAASSTSDTAPATSPATATGTDSDSTTVAASETSPSRKKRLLRRGNST